MHSSSAASVWLRRGWPFKCRRILDSLPRVHRNRGESKAAMQVHSSSAASVWLRRWPFKCRRILGRLSRVHRSCGESKDRLPRVHRSSGESKVRRWADGEAMRTVHRARRRHTGSCCRSASAIGCPSRSPSCRLSKRLRRSLRRGSGRGHLCARRSPRHPALITAITALVEPLVVAAVVLTGGVRGSGARGSGGA